jgi:hypothetical protein
MTATIDEKPLPKTTLDLTVSLRSAADTESGDMKALLLEVADRLEHSTPTPETDPIQVPGRYAVLYAADGKEMIARLADTCDPRVQKSNTFGDGEAHWDHEQEEWVGVGKYTIQYEDR